MEYPNIDEVIEIAESDYHIIAASLNNIAFTKGSMYSICESLLSRNKINPFLKRMPTDDDKDPPLQRQVTTILVQSH